MLFNKSLTGIILVAGNSTRFGKNKNKNFEIVNGNSVLSYSIKAFCDNEYIDDIIIVAKKEEEDMVNRIISNFISKKSIHIIFGGCTRQQSVYNAIKSTNSDIVIIHDGARPAIKQDYINNIVKTMNNYSCATIGVKSIDTIKIANDEGIVLETTKRDNTWIIQTPQCFDRKILLDLHEKFKDFKANDDCVFFEKSGYKCKIIEGDYTNIKITTYNDIAIIKNFI